MKSRYLLPLMISFTVFALDQLTKLLILRTLHFLDVVTVLPVFNIVYYRNIGSAFGMFRELGNLFFITVSSVAIICILILIYKDRENSYGLALILGGAAGNLLDRLLHGYVIDFLEFHAGRHYWPAFNIADSALSLGILLLLLNSFPRGSST
ncbi:MAG: signal peptidase II [Nitrospirae bacterium]|nr:MAG: signal peptidase II [Nitrospirota bacterium]